MYQCNVRPRHPEIGAASHPFETSSPTQIDLMPSAAPAPKPVDPDSRPAPPTDPHVHASRSKVVRPSSSARIAKRSKPPASSNRSRGLPPGVPPGYPTSVWSIAADLQQAH